MRAERALATLLADLAPVLHAAEYVFCSLPPGAPVPAGTTPFATVREDEGLTLILERGDAGTLPSSAPFRAITLGVHSHLEAVGLTAAVAGALAAAGIAANIVAGTHHDHVFVPAGRAAEAMAVLRAPLQ